MDTVEEYLMPIGFKELMEYLNEQKSNIVKAKDIQTALSQKHRFSSGKVAGTIKRAEEKQLLTRIGRGVYKYNPDGAKQYSMHYIAVKTADKVKQTNNTEKQQNALTKMNQIIKEASKKIDDEIPASEMFNLTSEDFQKAKNKVDVLRKLAQD